MVLEEETGSYESANGGVPIPHEYRRSIDQYYQRDLETDPLDQPPSYDALIPPPSWRRRFNVQPREDEGRETLPAYSSYISLESIFEKKMELEGAVHKAQDRNWYKVWVTLQGTALTFHKCKSEGFFHRSEGGRRPNADFPAGQKQMSFIRSYNLQHADVGIASDYTKKRYVIRVRAEADQFLLSCTKIETLVLWLQSLFAAIDLAFPLDDRQIPRDFSIPRQRRRLARAGFGAIGDMERNSELIREQEDILRTQFPRLAGQIEEEADEPTTDSEQSSRPDTSPTPSPARSTASSTRLAALRAPRFISRARQAIQPIANFTTFQPNIPNPSITSEGKWRPDHQWTHFYDMMYARRCMAVLTERSPRKSNLVIMKGKQWVVDWSTGTLTRCQPPGYEEVTSGAEAEKLTELHSGSGGAGPSRVRV